MSVFCGIPEVLIIALLALLLHMCKERRYTVVLIIAEKPSLARNIVQGIGQMQKRTGYYEGLGYIVTWAFGHLFTLYDINDYTGAASNARWNMDELPCFPESFRFPYRRREGHRRAFSR